MTLDDAARWTPSESVATKLPPQRQEPFQQSRKAADLSNIAQTQNSADVEKKRWQAAMDQAKNRGLDKAGETQKAAREAANTRRSNSKTRRDPIIHTDILLKETTFSTQEISEITGLDVYKVIAMKLKLRNAA